MKYKTQSGSLAFLLHRLTGVMLIAYLLLHIYILTGLYDPQAFAEEMKILSHPVAQAVEFMLFLPILFHSLNGIRLILIEWTDKGSKNHKKILSAVYAVSIILAVAMLFLFLNHEPYQEQKVDNYTKKAVEQIKNGGHDD